MNHGIGTIVEDSLGKWGDTKCVQREREVGQWRELCRRRTT